MVSSETSVSIMHLSDLHFGGSAKREGDYKDDPLPYAYRPPRYERLRTWLMGLPAVPDYVVVSGDITTQGNPKGFTDFNALVCELQAIERFPDDAHIVVVPGNHDVAWTSDPAEDVHVHRWKSFQAAVGERYVRPWLPTDPPPTELYGLLSSSIRADDESNCSDLGGYVYPPVESSSPHALPFLFDRTKGVLIYAFNSASVSGSPRQFGPATEKFLREPTTPDTRLDSVRKELEPLRWLDPARIDPHEIELFNFVLDALETHYSAELRAALRVAVLHHHVLPMPQEEVKAYELIINAGIFISELADRGFDLVLHGHKHYPEVLIDNVPRTSRKLSVVSGGTICGPESPGTSAGFWWIDWSPATRELDARFVELGISGTVSRALQRAPSRPLAVGDGVSRVARDQMSDSEALVTLIREHPVGSADLLEYSCSSIEPLLFELKRQSAHVRVLMKHPESLGTKFQRHRVLQQAERVLFGIFAGADAADTPSGLEVRFYRPQASLRGRRLGDSYINLGWYTPDLNGIHPSEIRGDTNPLITASLSSREGRYLCRMFDGVFMALWNHDTTVQAECYLAGLVGTSLVRKGPFGRLDGLIGAARDFAAVRSRHSTR